MNKEILEKLPSWFLELKKWWEEESEKGEAHAP
jgi:hypothetical protein